MSSNILLADNGVTSGTAGIKTQGGSDGTLVLQSTNSSGTALTGATIDNNQNFNITNSLNTPNTFGFKNRIINGAMGIWQRGTSVTNSGSGGPASAAYSCVDRFQIFRVGFASNANASQQTSGVPSAYKYYLRVQRTSGDTNTSVIIVAQSLETVNMLDLSGGNVTFQVMVRCGSNFSPTSNSVYFTIYYGTGTDGNLASGFTSQAAVVSTAYSVTSSWATYTVTGQVPSGASQLGVNISWIPTGTAGTNDYLDIVGVQLEKGSTATSFDYRPYGTELALCQRYYEKSYNNSVAPGTSVTGGTSQLFVTAINSGATFTTVNFAVSKRAAPTITTYDNAGTAGKNSYYVTSWNNGGSPSSLTSFEKGFYTGLGGTGALIYLNADWTASSEL